MVERGQATELKTMRNKVTGALVSAKWVQRESGAALGKQTEREIINHRKLLHPHIIRLLEVCYLPICFLHTLLHFCMQHTSNRPFCLTNPGSVTLYPAVQTRGSR